MIVDIVDIGSGNIKSIQNWIERLNIQTRVVKKASEIKSEFLVLPGVGSAGPYMDKLKKNSFDTAIIDHVNDNKRLLGICLGFQIMGEYSSEDGGVEGLRLIDGHTDRLAKNVVHNGWESFDLRKDNLNGHSLNSSLNLRRIKHIKGRVFYNHEYGFLNKDRNSFNMSISDTLDAYSSITIKNKVIGIQFHPEKSQTTGLDLMSIIL